MQVLLSAQVADLYFGYRTTLLRIDIAEQQCGHPETQPRDHREDIQGRPGLGTGRAAGQDAVPRHAVDDPGPSGDAREAAQRTRRPARPQAGRGAGTRVRSRGRCRPSEPLVVREFRRAAAAPAGHPHGRLAGRRAVGADRRCKADYFPAITLFGSIGWSANSLANSPDTSSSRRRPGADAGTCSTSGGFAATCACRTPACSNRSSYSRTTCSRLRVKSTIPQSAS